MNFVWFWTFWHWSRESHRGGALLLDPLHGIAAHWDEWYRHEASDRERQEIAATGCSENGQRRFLGWLIFHWVREAGYHRNRSVARFVVRQLAQMPPFNQCAVFARYGAGYHAGGLSAVILGEASRGQPEDVRTLEAIVLPKDSRGVGTALVTEGFQAASADLEIPRAAASSLLRGKGLLWLLLRWTLTGRRPYSRAMAVTLTAGWLLVAALITVLAVGPEPGARLVPLTAGLMVLWLTLTLSGVTSVILVAFDTWWAGREWSRRLEQSQIRLRMPADLTIQGASAGLAFCLNILLGAYRAHPAVSRRSWLWEVLLRRLASDHKRWAATGIITAETRVKPVMLEAKLRAALEHHGIDHLLSPRQPEATRAVARPADSGLVYSKRERAAATRPARHPRFGFAAEQPRLMIHPCRDAAQAMMAIGGISSGSQAARNGLAVALSVVMAVALPDVANIVLPPPAPVVVGPAAPSPYFLWVNLDTRAPDAFQAVLHSAFWANRRAEVMRFGGANGSVRAEIPLRRLNRQNTRDQEHGLVLIERRRQFLHREFLPGERVGSYSVAYLNRLTHE